MTMTPTDQPRAVVSDREVITITRLFDAPRDLVFAAWTAPEHVERWWGPAGFSAFGCKIEPRVGGIFQIQMRGPDGLIYPCVGVFREIEIPERIVFAGPGEASEGCGGGLPPRSVVTVTFVAIDDKTEVTIHTRMESMADREAAQRAGYMVGWQTCLERLEKFVREG